MIGAVDIGGTKIAVGMVSEAGRVLARAGPDSEELLVVDIDPAEALDKKVTPRNDLFADRRADLYSI